MSVPFIKTCGFQCVAHRGFSGAYAENTLLAFEKAYDAGATMLELDVRMTADERVVILHDATLSRLAKNKRVVSKIRWDTLRKIEICDEGAREHPHGHVSLLEELFDRFDAGVFYYIEVKHSKSRPNDYHFALCQKVLDMVRERKLLDRTMLVSFEFSLLECLREAAPEICLGWNFNSMRMYEKYGARARQIDAELCPKEALCTPARINDWKLHGHLIMPWVVNSVPRMKELIGLGVNGITTDEVPDLIPLVPVDTLCKR